MKWYLNALYRFYRWYSNYSASDSRPEGWATVLFLLCHYLNAMAILLVYARVAAKGNVWLIEAGQKLIAITPILFLVYVFYFGPKLRNRRKKMSDEDEMSFVSSPADIGVMLYLIGSLVTAVGATCYAAAK